MCSKYTSLLGWRLTSSVGFFSTPPAAYTSQFDFAAEKNTMYFYPHSPAEHPPRRWCA